MSDKKESSLLTVVVVLVFIAAVFVYNREPRTPTPGGTSTNVVNPTHVQFESLDHDTVTRYEIDVINAAGTVEQTIVVPKASTLVQAAGVEAPLKLYPLTPGTYRLAVRAQVAVAAASGTSPDGTRVPPAPNIVDAEGAVWTLAADGLTVNRNGQNAGGRGTPLLWQMGGIYVLGTDGDWWQYTGGGWVDVGATDPAGGATAQPGGTATVASSPTSAPSNEWIRGPIAVY
jgi:hypothetical protein